MPNLPNTTPDIDKKTFYELVFNPDLQADEWKIYPTSVTTTSDKDDEPVNTVIEKWYNEGKYVPYSHSELMDVLIYAKCIVPNYIRISRIFRDIPLPNITGGADKPHLRQILQKEMKDLGYKCDCIRCREIKQTKFNIDDIEYDYLSYDTKNNINYFISANYNTKLVGFLRLSVKKKKIKTLDVLDNASVVRELHIYGKMKATYLSNSSNSQNRGIGTQLLKIAEDITMSHNLSKITVISGVGVRNFYKKNGYCLKENYMTKRLVNYYNYYIILLWFILVSLSVYICFI
jgi:ELP3 family radical SAM enzyme/protein acetyltransferase